jgi:hypothetical protein
MTIKSIINNVRWVLDEEKGQPDYETVYMDNIIKSRINDALRWIIYNADTSLLDGSDTNDGTGCIIQEELPSDVETKATLDGAYVRMPSDFVRLVRVKVTGWARAIHEPIAEDSEQYLMQSDAVAKADKTRPQAAIVSTLPNKIELFPTPLEGDKVEITYAVTPGEIDTSASEDTSFGIPPKLKTAFIYYLAYLVMIAYDDNSKANSMLATAKMNAGIST